MTDNVAEFSASALSLDKRLVLILEFLRLTRRRDLFDRPRHLFLQQFIVKGFVDKVESAQQKCFMRRRFICKSRHHDHFDIRLQLARSAQEFNATHIRHFHIRDNYVSGLLTQQ